MVSKIFRICARVLCGFSFMAATSAMAQPAEVQIGADQDWEHQWTQMRLPAQIGEFERTGLTEFEGQETNIGSSYFARKTGTILSIYIYRPQNASTSIWFDRALIAIGVPEVEESYGTVDLEDLKIGVFTPNGGDKASGLYSVLAVEGNFRSTAVALYRADQWLVKVRISSQTLSVGEMEAMLKTALNDLPTLENIDATPAYFVEECPSPLEADGAQPVQDNLGAIALAQAAALAASQIPQDEVNEAEQATLAANPATLPYCRQGTRSRSFNIFQAIDGSDRFSVAIGDAGQSIEVYPDTVAGALNPGESRIIYAVQMATGLEYSLHTPFAGRPNLEQISGSVNGATIAKVSRTLEEAEGASITLGVRPD